MGKESQYICYMFTKNEEVEALVSRTGRLAAGELRNVSRMKSYPLTVSEYMRYIHT